MGASHAIGHQLRPVGVPHGKTSCILMPAVARWNARVNSAEQKKAVNILWSEPKIRAVLITAIQKSQEGRQDRALCDVLFAIFRHLKMPQSLKEVGMSEEQLGDIARRTLIDSMAKTNAISLKDVHQVLEILEMVIERTMIIVRRRGI